MTSKNKTNNVFLIEKDYTLIEVLVTVMILVVIAVPSVKGLIEKAREVICLANRVELKSCYLTYIQSSGLTGGV